MNEAFQRIGAPAAYAQVAGTSTRLHRSGSNTLPAVGRDNAPPKGAYVRMWARLSDGTWVLQVDAFVPAS